MKIILTRPLSESNKLKQIIEEKANFECFISPMLEIEIFEKEIFIPEGSNILITSANGVKALAKNTKIRNYNVYTVGKNSAEEAERMGFQNIISATNEISKNSGEIALYNFIRDNFQRGKFSTGEIFYHISAEVTKGNLGKLLEKDGFNYLRKILYRANKKTISEEVLNLINSEGKLIVLFFSERTARIFNENIINSSLTYPRAGFSNITALCLSKSIAGSIQELDYENILFPKYPNQESLIEKLTTFVIRT